MTDTDKIIMSPETKSSSIDPSVFLLANNGMNNMNPLWMMFMYPFIFPFMNMFGGGMWGNGR